MRMLKKKKTNDEGTSYWQSFGDLMSGVLIVFILLFIYKLFDYQESMNQKQEMINDLTNTRAQIIMLLQEEFKNQNIDIVIDGKTGAITLSEGILFDFGKSDLKDEGKEFLEQFIPKYLKILLEDEKIKSHVSQIIIEGHTDDNSSYIYNLKLSQERAFSVIDFLVSDDFDYYGKDEIENYLTANGRSFSETIKNEDGTVNEEASRRVEIKFRLDEEEMLEDINKSFLKDGNN